MDPVTATQINSAIQHLELTREQQDEDERHVAKLVKKESREISIIAESHRSPEERIRSIQARYMELFQSCKRLEREQLRTQKIQAAERKERDTLKADLHKVNIQKQKIENLCRELQKENRKVKEKCETIVQSQKQEREELSTKFVSTISEIRSEITQVRTVVGIPDSPETTDSISIASVYDTAIKEKLMNFFNQWNAREKQFEAAISSSGMENRLLEAKVEQQKQVVAEDSLRISNLKSQIASFLNTERDLRRQLQVYVDKFRQVEETLNKSNELFSTFRIEMEAMTSKTKRLESDNLNLKARLDAINSSMVQIAQERNKTRKIIDAARFGKEKLESLCRALQAERNELRKRLSQYESPLNVAVTNLPPPIPLASMDLNVHSRASAPNADGVSQNGPKSHSKN
ncbi:myosin-like coiled-coil protein-domain-containing protein [Chytriomyces sp. MP71]|nr:myosin-like coiled-coil protein-domain-containing protein [Chytriomyces sp. MP71]